MEGLIPADLTGLQRRETEQSLLALNETIGVFGLQLSRADAAMLAERRFETLQATNRIEFGEGILPRLVFAFCDSPYIPPQEFADTIALLQDSFYHFKNECLEKISDDELIEFMKQQFNGVAHGSLDFLNGTLLETLAEDIRFGRPASAPGAGVAADEAEGEVDDDE